MQTMQKGEQSSMNNEKHYPTHPGAEHPPTMCMEIPVEEYEAIKRENKALRRSKHSADAVLRSLKEHGVIDVVTFDGTYTVKLGQTIIHGVA